MDIQTDISGTILDTGRLILREWNKNDLYDFYEYASVPGVGEMAGWRHHESPGVTQKVLDSFISDKNVFAVVFKENFKVIGSLGLHYSWANNFPEYENLKMKEIGYVLSKDYWGRGLIPEAVREVIHLCFDKWDLDALTAGHFSNNNQSRRVIEKCGFKFVKFGEFYARQLQMNFDDMKYILLNPHHQLNNL